MSLALLLLLLSLSFCLNNYKKRKHFISAKLGCFCENTHILRCYLSLSCVSCYVYQIERTDMICWSSPLSDSTHNNRTEGKKKSVSATPLVTLSYHYPYEVTLDKRKKRVITKWFVFFACSLFLSCNVNIRAYPGNNNRVASRAGNFWFLGSRFIAIFSRLLEISTPYVFSMHRAYRSK